ncbi:putative MFS family arabinose efflux permease [Cytobacillus horneckiae]|uniref:MFS transporter n=1 Tax=Cytobacillus horneckiae TaxID=549687 RepID=UPI0019D27D1F|nr:MFS transporter [Cytobacillus horneckiae]MBN6889529.1 MFS transporter [Cytobacillus horneckiae]MEC1156627.1 MFS transporter [Cytobacillus horneckiae]MED2939151.1 MFS transporter [Cytobacillus horneckiae]
MRRFHYSWIILFVVFFSIIVAGITRSSSGVFIIPFEQEFGWDRSLISLAIGISLFIYGLSGPFMGAIVQIIGIKRMMLISMGTLMAGLLLTFFMKETWHLILIWGLIIGLGSSLFLTVLSPIIANTWFKKRRGLAVGILTASSATGQLVLLPVLAYIIELYDWQFAVALILTLSAIMFVILIFLMKESPEAIGETAYGADENKSEDIRKNESKNPFLLAFIPLKEAIRIKEFWLLAGSFFICGLSTSGLIGTHFVSLCVGYGIAVVTAASLLSFMGIFDLVGTTLSGWLSDRIDNRWLLFWYYSLRGLSLLLLPFALSEGSYILLIIFSVFYGLDWIATVPPTVNISRNIFGLEKSVIVYGWIFAAHQAGAAVASFGGGVIFERFNSYAYAFLGAGALCFLASLFVIVIKKEKGITVV